MNRYQEAIHKGYVATREGVVYGPRLHPIGSPGKNGYRSFIAVLDDGKSNLLEHVFVWTFFFGPVPEGLVVDHVDGNRHNNDLKNLEIVTQQENLRRARERGSLIGKTHGPEKRKAFFAALTGRLPREAARFVGIKPDTGLRWVAAEFPY